MYLPRFFARMYNHLQTTEVALITSVLTKLSDQSIKTLIIFYGTYIL